MENEYNTNQRSSANGDFWKGLVSSGIKTYQNQNQLSEDELKQLYKETGSKKTFSDWFNSPEGRDAVNSVLNLTTEILNKDKPTTTPLPVKKEEEKPATTILWMHPLTFGVVAVVTLVTAIIVIPMLTKQKLKTT